MIKPSVNLIGHIILRLRSIKLHQKLESTIVILVIAKAYKEKHEKTKLHIKNLSYIICSKCNLSLTKENYFKDKWNKCGIKSQLVKNVKKIIKENKLFLKFVKLLKQEILIINI